MRAFCHFGYFAGLLALAAPAAAAPETRTAAEIASAVIAATGNDDCKTAFAEGKRAIAHAGFKALARDEQARLFALTAYCGRVEKADEDAYPFSLEATRLKPELEYAWRVRFGIEGATGRHEALVKTTELMASASPQALSQTPIAWIYEAGRGLRDHGDRKLWRRFLAVVTGPAYQPEDPLATRDGLIEDYAALLEEAGETDAARAQLTRLVDPSSLARISVDRRLRGLLDRPVDLRAAAEAQLARMMDIAASRSQMLDVSIEATRYLRMLGRADEALALLKSVDPNRPGQSKRAGTDKINWWWDSVARSHAQLGHAQEAIDAFLQGADTRENGGLNVSQILNLAGAQLRFEKPQDALATLAQFAKYERGVSGYGNTVFHSLRACALAMVGRAADAQADKNYLLAHERDGWRNAVEGTFCLGDADAAAAILVRQLNDPDRQASALLSLSSFVEPPPTLSAFARRSRIRQAGDAGRCPAGGFKGRRPGSFQCP